MLNLYKRKLLNENNSSYTDHKLKSLKHFSDSIREWNSSVYVFNKNTLNLIPSVGLSSLQIIKGYFSLYNKKIEAKIRTKRLSLRFKRLSSNKIYISNGEFKHTNKKVVINLYIFNRQKQNYLLTVKKTYLRSILKIVKLKKLFNKRLMYINVKGFELLNNTTNANKYLLINTYNNKLNSYIYNYTNNFLRKILKRYMNKLFLYVYYKQLIHLNRSKFNFTHLQYLKTYLYKLHNKNIEFNLINLKRFYLNSDILSESITLKLTRNRRGILKYITNLKNKVKLRKKRFYLGRAIKLNDKLNTKKNMSEYTNNLLEKKVLNSLKYKNVTGFRLETKGRLTRRHTASRSAFKIRYKGNLLNIDPSYRGLSAILLKGNLESNLQYTKLKSKTRIGSFGIKGWISGN